MTSSPTIRRCARLAAALGLVTLFALASAAPGWSSGSGVMPASATPHGYSLQEMASATAPFTRGGNDPALYSDTPFQVLYVTDVNVEMAGSGILATGTNEFSVGSGTPLYVPIFNVNDVPPVLGTFPTTAAQASSYFFDQSQYGGRDFEVIVDGTSTPTGAAYLTGPLPIAGTESHVITLGAMVHPLSVGTHTVEIRGGIFGDLVDDTYGIASIQEDFTYTVEVVAAG